MARVVLDESEAPINALAKLGTPALAAHNNTKTWAQAYAGSTLTPREREAWRQRLAHFEGCEYCATIRSASHQVADQNVPDAFYDNIFNSDWSGYTARERLIIQVIERFAEDHEALRDDDAFWAEMHEHFSDTEIVDLCYHMIGPQLMRALMAKVLLGFSEFCEVQASPPLAAGASSG
jgi:alkylhydroperoxidase family enzyme